MAQRKTYQSIHYITHDTYVDVNGKKVQILFRGGSLKPRINGKYSTSNLDVIAALDKGARAKGATYRCIGISDDGTPEPVKKQEPAPEVPAAGPAVPEATPAHVPDDFKVVEGISTVQKARDFLIENVPGMTAAKLPNGQAIKNQAAANKIYFTDLK